MKSFYVNLVILIIINGKSVIGNTLSLNNILTSNISKLYYLNDLQIDCMKSLIKQEVPCGSFFTLVHRNNTEDRLLQQLSANNCYNFIVKSPKSQKWLLRPNAYIIFLKNVIEFAEDIDKMSKEFEWTPTAKFFIIIQHLNNEEYLKVFTILSKLNIYYVHLMPLVPADEIYVYTYNPFLNNSCGNINKENVEIYLCKENKKKGISRYEKENYLRNCPITVLAIEYPPNVIFDFDENVHYRSDNSTGIEQYMLNNIAERENYKLQYILSIRHDEYEFQRDDCTSTTALGHLANHSLAISIGGYVLMKKRSECFDFFWGYCYANFKVYTPLPDPENWRKVYQPFGITTWALIAVSLCTVAFTSIKIYNLWIGKKNKYYLTLRLFGYLNNHSDQQLFKIRKLRIIMIMWIWFTFFIISFYETALFRLLTAPIKKGGVLNPDTLFLSSLKPCLSFKIRAWFKFTYNLTLSTQVRDECLTEERSMQAVAREDDLYTIIPEPTFYNREYEYLDNHGYPILNSWLFGKGDFVYTAFVNRGFPLVEKFRRYAFYHFESGLLLKLKHSSKSYHKFMLKEYDDVKLKDFKIPFGILIFGYIISSVIFIIELNYLGENR